MKKLFAVLLMTCAISAPAFAQGVPDMAKNEAALKSLGPSLCETMRMLNSPDTADALPPRIDVPVSADDMKRFGATDVAAGQSMTVSFIKGGQVLVNNQDITPAIKGLCASQGGTTGTSQSLSTTNIPGMQ